MLLTLLQFFASKFLVLALHLEAGSFPRPLSPQEEIRAFADLRAGDSSAREKLIRHNLRLVAHIAKKYYALKKTWWRIAGRLNFLFWRGLGDRFLYRRFRLFCLRRRVVFRCRWLFLLRCRLWLRWWLARLQAFEDRIITVTLFLLEFLKNCRAFSLWN